VTAQDSEDHSMDIRCGNNGSLFTICSLRYNEHKKTTNSKNLETKTVKFSRLLTEVRTPEYGYRFPPFQHQTVSAVAIILY